MAASPPKDTDIEHQSGEEEGDMSRTEDAQLGGLGDFEVKEQDRWLPIANGWSSFIIHVSPQVPPTHDGPDACVTLSLPLWTVMVDEVNGFEHRGTTVCATATLHLGRWLDKQNMPIRHLCASSQP